MSIFEAIISGLVQGLTEFLPISSSGHLAIIHSFFGVGVSYVFFDICLHLATLMVVVFYFRKDIADIYRRRESIWILYLILGTVPAVLAALLFEKKILLFFQDPRLVFLMLMATGVVLFAGQIVLRMKKAPGGGPDLRKAVLVGLAQACALIPGISRSGTTISAGIASGMKSEEAFRFAFLLAIPAISGAILYKLVSLEQGEIIVMGGINFLIGMTCSFAAGLASLYVLKRVIIARKLYLFGAYCLIAGAAGMMFWK